MMAMPTARVVWTLDLDLGGRPVDDSGRHHVGYGAAEDFHQVDLPAPFSPTRAVTSRPRPRSLHSSGAFDARKALEDAQHPQGRGPFLRMG